MITIYHNPRCSKSRQTLELIHASGEEHTVIEYLKSPLDSDTLQGIASALGGTIAEMMRTTEKIYKELGLHAAETTDTQRIEAIIEHPILLQRPIVIRGQQAIIGRPPENVNSLLS